MEEDESGVSLYICALRLGKEKQVNAKVMQEASSGICQGRGDVRVKG